MKSKGIFLGLMSAAIVLLLMASCSDYDNGYTESAIKFSEEFKKAYGDIDPEQDWNLAERATVTVSVVKSSNIKIYAQKGAEYAIVGDYANVSGTRVLGFDMVEGTESIMVSDGVTAQTVKPGDVVVFSQDTRTVYEHDLSNGNEVFVQKLKDPDGYTISGDYYPTYRYSNDVELADVLRIVPEIGSRKTYTNLNNVTHDFSYVSQGPFVIYPYYWNTSSKNTIGIYYYDENGENPKELDVYTIQEGDELMYEKEYAVLGETVYTEGYGGTFGWTSTPPAPNDWTISGGNSSAFHLNGWSKESEESGLTRPFIEYYGQLNQNIEMSKTIAGLAEGEYYVEVKARLVYEDSETMPSGLTFSANDGFVDMGRAAIGKNATYQTEKNGKTITCSERYSNADDFETGAHNTKKMYVVCQVGSDGKLTVKFNLTTASVGNWFAFNGLTVKKVIRENRYTSTDGAHSFSTASVRGQGIFVNVPTGRKFGMYLKKTDTSDTGVQHPYKYYSESALNDPYNGPAGFEACGSGVTDDGLNNSNSVQQMEGLHPCYASTFYTSNGQMFLGFEDWPNIYNNSDFDLNDVVFAFAGHKPIIINEDPEPAGSWMLACEDLGGSFDTDYNDVVFKVTHISGQTKASITPLAAGGTLTSYIFFIDPSGSGANDKCFGEIHQLFGEDAAASGEYSPINVGYSRGSVGKVVDFVVSEDWTMAAYSSDTWNSESDYNMGGFEIRTLPFGNEAPSTVPNVGSSIWSGASRIPAPDLGEAPYIICLPYSYVEENKPDPGYKTETVWAWPQELVNITNCYTDFNKWVGNHTTYGEWYKNKDANGATVEPLQFVTGMNTNELMASDLNVISSTAYTVVDRAYTLKSNITTTGTGKLTYKVWVTTDGGNNWWVYQQGDLEGNTTFTPNREGDVRVEVTQEADATHTSKTVEYILHANPKKTNAAFGSKAQFVVWNNTEIWAWDQVGHKLPFYTGDKIMVEASLNTSDATGAITARLDDVDNTGSIFSQNGNKFYVTMGPRSGVAKLRIHYAGDSKYNEADILVTIQVKAAEVVRFTTGGLAMTYTKGEFKLQNSNGNDLWQMWRLEDTGNGLYALFNIGERKYLHLVSESDGHGAWGTVYDKNADDAANYRFEIKSDGRLRVRTFGRLQGSYGEKYLGFDNYGSGQTIFLDKTGDKVIYWSKQNVDINTINNNANAKQRNAKQRK